MHVRFVLILVLGVLAASRTPASAQSSPQSTTATISANLATLAKLTLSTASVTFPDANPDVSPQVTAVQGDVSITTKARATPGAQVLLTVQASDDLRSGVQVIPASAITWTATGTGFTAGTLSKSASVHVGQWVGSGIRTGTQTLLFQNLWTYATGTYTCSLVYTLVVP